MAMHLSRPVRKLDLSLVSRFLLGASISFLWACGPDVNGPVLTTELVIPVQTCTQGSACDFTPVTASGGSAPYAFAATGGVLPAGMSFSSATGAFGGTPTNTVNTNFTITVTDAANATSSSGFQLIVNPAPALQREDFSGTSVPSGWQATSGSWSVGGGLLTGSFSVVNIDPQLIRTNPAGIPKTIRAMILNTPGAPQGAAGIAFNWVSSTQYYAIELRTNNATLSADIVSLGPGGTQVLASCPAGLANTDTWYVLELTDTPTGLLGRLLDGAGTPTSCSMQVPGADVTNSAFGVVAYSGGGLVKVDWIETDID